LEERRLFFCEKGVLRPNEKGYQLGMTTRRKPVLALFYCQNTPDSGNDERQALEKKYGDTLRLFPIPCSGRLEPLHLLRALEDFADAGYVITCPKGACRYFEGNLRAKKRVERTREMIKSIGLEEERVGLLTGNKESPKSLTDLAGEVMDRLRNLPPSPVLSPFHQDGGQRSGQTDKGEEG
jgi:F420-non-reducing hydrogenase iron-sulfur subunit